MTSDKPNRDGNASVDVPQAALDAWAQTALRENHLNTLVQRAIEDGDLIRARALAERARAAAWSMFNEMLVCGAENAACDPEFPYVHWHRGLALEALGNPEEARSRFDAFAQGLSTTGKPVPEKLRAAVREKLHSYDLLAIYQLKV
jgi:hypothetical protein